MKGRLRYVIIVSFRYLLHKYPNTVCCFKKLNQLEEMDEANEPNWMDKLDVYMSIEKDAWREQATLTRENIVREVAV